MVRIITSVFFLLLLHVSKAQITIQHGSDLHLQNGAAVYVQGDIESYAPISGNGILSLSGDKMQTISMHGFSLPKLEINNPDKVGLAGNLSIGESLFLMNGKLQCNNYDLVLEAPSVINRTGTSSFIETNGTGQIHKKIAKDISGFLIPTGNESIYAPIILTTTGSYSNAFITLSSKGTASPNKPGITEDYLNNFWRVEREGIQGTVTALAQYSDKSAIKGSEEELQGYYWDKTGWKEASLSAEQNLITAKITGDGGQIYAMNSFRKGKVGLMPNPAVNSSTLHIYSSQGGKGNIVITDAAGKPQYRKIVQLSPGLNQVNINLQRFANGQYDIHFRSSGVQKTFKLIKQ